ncbi:YpiF family protein [Salsuginibacillus kocurii]|uniref:YpiF family protein n=1 Tax=Salsuginibacillus kocurii TaxID=427078 RepID=UPI00038211C6|nr:YpiF family protein [Salsuginibacillus kocurii]
MKWNTTDIDTYFHAKEYVDTVLVPLIPVGFGEGMKSQVAMGEYITIMAEELEKQFKGRVLKVPPFTYAVDETNEERLERVNSWGQMFEEEGKTFTIFLTADAEWKKTEDSLPGMLIWLPLLPLEHLEVKHRRQAVSDQLKQILPLIMNEWKKNP